MRAHVRCAFHVLAGQGWVAFVTDVGMHVVPWSKPFVDNGCVLIVGVFDLPHEHLVMGKCTHGAWHNSMCDIVVADGVHATHMLAWVRTHCL